MEIEELLNGVYGNLVQRHLIKERIDVLFHDVAISLQRGGFMLRDFIQHYLLRNEEHLKHESTHL